MANNERANKQFTESARRGIRGEAVFESLIVTHAIPHRIARQNDLGVNFLCEWIYGDHPTGIQFLAQVKTAPNKYVIPESVEKPTKNGLCKFTLQGAPNVDERTLNYWAGLGLPSIPSRWTIDPATSAHITRSFW